MPPPSTEIFFSASGWVAGPLVTEPSLMLNLLPWQEPPCWGDTERCDPDAKKLLQKMLAAGVSRFTRSADGIATGQPTQAI